MRWRDFLALHPTEALLSGDVCHYLLHHVDLLHLSVLFMHHPKMYTELQRNHKCPSSREMVTCHPFHRSRALWSPERSMWLLLYDMVCNACIRTYSLNHFVNHTCTNMKCRNPSNPPASGGLIHHYIMLEGHQWLTHLPALLHPLTFQIFPLYWILLLWHIQPSNCLHRSLTKHREQGATQLGVQYSWSLGEQEDGCQGWRTIIE